jgi:hypothetical protein
VKLLTTLLALALAPACLRALDFQPVLNTDLRGGYAATVDGDASSLALLDFSFVPALRSGKLSLLPTLYANAGGQERSISEGTTFVRTAQAGFKPSLRTDIGSGRSYSLRLEASRNWNIETLGETWGSGFYDYDQYGAGAELDLPASDLGFTLTVGGDFAHRGYPNYHNIGAASSLTDNKNFYIKDFYASSAELAAGFDFMGLQLSYRPEVRNYTDSYVVVKGGTVDLGTLQRDILQTVDANGGVGMGHGLSLNIDLSLADNSSNQGSFDLVFNRFLPSYLNYVTETLSLSLPWKADALWQGLVLAPNYQLTLDETQKPVQNADASYTSDDEIDVQHNFGLGLKKSLPWGLNWVADGSYRVVRSNQEYVRGVLNSYDYWQASTGLSYAFAAAGGESPQAVKKAVEAGMDDPDYDQSIQGLIK